MDGQTGHETKSKFRRWFPGNATFNTTGLLGRSRFVHTCAERRNHGVGLRKQQMGFTRFGLDNFRAHPVSGQVELSIQQGIHKNPNAHGNQHAERQAFHHLTGYGRCQFPHRPRTEHHHRKTEQRQQPDILGKPTIHTHRVIVKSGV